MGLSNGWTPTESRIIDLLSDGSSRTKGEMLACLQDDQAEVATVQVHVSNIRTKLRPKGKDIVCESKGKYVLYRMVRLLTDPFSE